MHLSRTANNAYGDIVLDLEATAFESLICPSRGGLPAFQASELWVCCDDVVYGGETGAEP
jgi:hypothetical protein